MFHTFPPLIAVTSSSEETSTVHSSQWSKKRRDLYESMTQEEQELFDELQSEIEELRNLLSRRDKGKEAAKKVSYTCIFQEILTEERSTPIMRKGI